MVGSVTSSAAIATLSVGQKSLDKDLLLQFLLKIASPLQLTSKIAKNASVPSLTLLSGVVLHQRNAIVRCLCGMGLHNALDQSPYYLLGGKGTMNLAAVSSWMSAADAVRRGDEESLDFINQHLETRSFLLDTMTVADLDLACAILQKPSSVEDKPNLQRWLQQCHAVLSQQGLTLPKLDPTPVTAPMFFFGTEDMSLIQRPAESKKKKQPPKQPAGDKPKEQPAKKGAKKPKAPAKQQNNTPADFDVSALDIRVGRIVKVWEHPEADKLFCEEIDMGDGETRKIASGLRPYYKASDLQDATVLVLYNLKARSLVGFPSHGMVMCASSADKSKVELVKVPKTAKLGERVEFEGISGDPEPENKVNKKKIFEKIAPDLKTNGDGVVVWKEHKAKISVGELGGNMADSQVS